MARGRRDLLPNIIIIINIIFMWWVRKEICTQTLYKIIFSIPKVLASSIASETYVKPPQYQLPVINNNIYC